MGKSHGSCHRPQRGGRFDRRGSCFLSPNVPDFRRCSKRTSESCSVTTPCRRPTWPRRRRAPGRGQPPGLRPPAMPAQIPWQAPTGRRGRPPERRRVRRFAGRCRPGRLRRRGRGREARHHPPRARRRDRKDTFGFRSFDASAYRELSHWLLPMAEGTDSGEVLVGALLKEMRERRIGAPPSPPRYRLTPRILLSISRT